jgi:hypothetical protein
MAIVYQHRRKDDNSIFYIGIGKNKRRAYSNFSRNKHWLSISKNFGFEVDILFEGISWQDACNVEIGLIDSYGRKDLGIGNLVNMTDGGEGIIGRLISEETKMKLKESKSNISLETRQKMKMSRIGKKSSIETIEKIKQNSKGSNNPKSKKVINTITGEIFDCAKYASDALGVKENTFRQWLRGERKNKTNFKYL